MPGDLNLKKSWHPGLHKNQARVYAKEQEALEERRRIQERQKEIKQQRERDELLKLQEMATGKKRVQKVEWMYQDPTAVGSQASFNEKKVDANSTDDYLLGKRRIDNLVKSKGDLEAFDDSLDRFRPKVERDADSAGGSGTADIITHKVKDDPMVAVRQKGRELGYTEESNESERRSRRERSRSRERERKRPRRKREDSRDRRNRRDREREGDRRRRRRDGELDGSKSSLQDERSTEMNASDGNSSRGYRADNESSRSGSPSRSRRDSYRPRDDDEMRVSQRKEREKEREKEVDGLPKGLQQMRAKLLASKKSGNSSSSSSSVPTSAPVSNTSKSATKAKSETDAKLTDKLARLKAMQDNAKALEEERDERLATKNKHEEAERLRDALLRQKSAQLGRSEFAREEERKDLK
ncbi:Pre-mRNA-splicing factor CWC25 [Yarrowia sp. E02]|nr:Pre-mRNA-splicing factor CWC25 [Yarrowia sp. E02]